MHFNVLAEYYDIKICGYLPPPSHDTPHKIGYTVCDSDSFRMVYYYLSSTVSPKAFIYAGKDKVESEYNSKFRPITVADNCQMRIS